MWLRLYQSASIWLCVGPSRPHSSTVPQVQIGGRPIRTKIATETASTNNRVRSGVGRRAAAGMAKA